MKYEFKKNKGILTVFLSGELDHHGAAPLRQATDREILGSNIKGLIIDMSGLEMMDSSGIGIIMGRCKLMESSGGHVCVSGARESIKKIIIMSGLGKYIGIFDTVKEAEKALTLAG